MNIIYESRQQNIYFQVNHNKCCEWPLHQHYWAEMIYTIHGQTRMQYLSHDQLITVDLKPHEMLFFFPNMPHCYLANATNGSQDFYTITFNPGINRQFEDMCMTYTLINPYFDTFTLHEDVRYLLQRFCRRDITAQSLNVLESYMAIFLEQLYSAFHLTKYELHCSQDFSSASYTHSEAPVNILKYIYNHFTENLTLDSVAKETGINKYTISRFFSQKMQMSFSTYINSLRLNTAQTLLANTDEDITNIIIDCGYQNQQVFNRNFKKRLGMTPSQYREKSGHFSLYPADVKKTVIFCEQVDESRNDIYLNGEYVCTEPIIAPIAHK